MNTTTKTQPATIYRLWLDQRDNNPITLHGWAETDSGRTDHWPPYPLCDNPEELPAKLIQLGLDLSAGATLADLTKGWDVYLRHPDLPALRHQLDTAH